MKKTVILPILMFLAFVLKTFFQIEVPEEILNGVADWAVNGILIGSTIIGIVKNYKNESEDKKGA